VHIWVNTVLKEDVYYYKPKDFFDDKYPKIDASHFVLVYQNRFQREQLRRFTAMLFVDGTHHINIYGHQLFTVVAQDAYGHGIPVCYIITTSGKTELLEHCLKIMKDRFEMEVNKDYPCFMCSEKACNLHKYELKPTYVMSDDDAAEHAAIRSVFPLALLLLCHWHLNVTWWRKCQALVPSGYARTVFDILKELIRTEKWFRFNRLVKTLYESCVEYKAEALFQYFVDYYLDDKRRGNLLHIYNEQNRVTIGTRLLFFFTYIFFL
jgi:MULE transposase domain